MKKGIAALLLSLVGAIGIITTVLIALFWPKGCESSLWLPAVYHNVTTGEVNAWFEGDCINIPSGNVFLNITSKRTNETVFTLNKQFEGANKDGYFLIAFNATGLEEGERYKLEATFPDMGHVSLTFYGGEMPSIE